MTQITRTPAPFPSTILALAPDERFQHGYTTEEGQYLYAVVTTITITPENDGRFTFQGMDGNGELWTDDEDHSAYEVNDLIPAANAELRDTLHAELQQPLKSTRRTLQDYLQGRNKTNHYPVPDKSEYLGEWTTDPSPSQGNILQFPIGGRSGRR